MSLIFLVLSLIWLAIMASGSSANLPNPTDLKRFAQACAGIQEGTGCTVPGVKLCCNEDLVNVIFCEGNGMAEFGTITFQHCTDGRICAPDGKGGIACFIPGQQPVPPP